MKHQLAFTLIETLITLTISFILLSLSFSFIKNFYSHTNDEIIQRKLLYAIQFAHQAARTRYEGIGLCNSSNHLSCSGNWEDGQIIFVDRNDNGIVRDVRDILAIIDMPPQQGKLYWRSFPIYRHYLLFQTTGFLQNNNGTFWFCHVGQSNPAWAIVLNNAGNVHLVYPDKKGVIKDSEDKLLSCAKNL